MSVYELAVRGETVRIEFTRINDSRHLPSYGTLKKPNLFRVTAAMSCRVGMPSGLRPQWATYADGDGYYPFHGMSFLSEVDRWDSHRGRLVALKEALTYPDHDGVLNGEIILAFIAEEKARIKPKGPARMPKARKPRQHRPTQMERMVAALVERIGIPTLVAPLLALAERHTWVHEVRPADSGQSTAGAK